MNYEWLPEKQREYRMMLDRVSCGGLCCPQGERQSCVCRGSCMCPVHGLICIGSHD